VDLDHSLSQNYTVRDLAITNWAGLNTPDPAHLDNLKRLADTLENLNYWIGPFRIHSGYRVHALQAYLTGRDPAAAQTSKLSFHEVGLAADIEPLTMSPMEYFRKLIGNSNVKNMLYEIIVKPIQGTLHLSADIGRGNIIKYFDGSGYKTMDPSEIFELYNTDQFDIPRSEMTNKVEDTEWDFPEESDPTRIGAIIETEKPKWPLFLGLSAAAVAGFFILRR